jgi:hypothetical protein
MMAENDRERTDLTGRVGALRAHRHLADLVMVLASTAGTVLGCGDDDAAARRHGEPRCVVPRAPRTLAVSFAQQRLHRAVYAIRRLKHHLELGRLAQWQTPIHDLRCRS